jgi:hypothetical protein
VRKRDEFDGSASDDRKGAGFAWGGLRRGWRIFVLEDISFEFPGIILGGLGYYFGLTSQDRVGQILGIAAAVLNVISMVISGLSGPPSNGGLSYLFDESPPRLVGIGLRS